MAATCASLNCGVVLMHTRGRPHEWRTLPALAPAEVLPLVLRELCVRRDAALAAGIRRDAIILDPGFGFGKSFDENFPLLSHFDALHALGFPLLAGLSRKGFLRRTLQQAESIHVPNPVQSTHPNHSLQDATTAANTAAILAGAHILRVHDVRPARQAAAIADRILTAASPHLPSGD
jgi:dihydropteroate synthase